VKVVATTQNPLSSQDLSPFKCCSHPNLHSVECRSCNPSL